jgi:hypothetical protein
MPWAAESGAHGFSFSLLVRLDAVGKGMALLSRVTGNLH